MHELLLLLHNKSTTGYLGGYRLWLTKTDTPLIGLSLKVQSIQTDIAELYTKAMRSGHSSRL